MRTGESPSTARRDCGALRTSLPSLIAGLCLLAASLGGCGATSGTGTPALNAAPLATSLTQQTGAWGVVPIGAASGPESFWELLHKDGAGSPWTLVTPPGVQDNGGLAIANAQSALLAGFMPSQNLRFSPLAVTHNGGAGWTPDLLAGGLKGVPDALALAADGTTYALLRRGGGEILRRRRAGGEWQVLVNALGLAKTRTASACAPSSIDAIAPDVRDGVLVGVACKRADQVGLYAYANGALRLESLQPPVSLQGARTAVLRVARFATSIFALVDFATARQNTLVAAWARDDRRTWAQTRGLALSPGERLMSTGPGLDEQAYALVAGAHGEKLWTCFRADPIWRADPSPPRGTAAIALFGAGTIEALAVRRNRIDSFRLTARSRAWRLTGTLKVSFA